MYIKMYRPKSRTVVIIYCIPLNNMVAVYLKMERVVGVFNNKSRKVVINIKTCIRERIV